MFFDKALLRCEEDYENLKSTHEQLKWGHQYGPITKWYIEKPERYPCICVYNHCEDSNGPNYYDGDYVYLEDFEDTLPDDGTGV